MAKQHSGLSSVRGISRRSLIQLAATALSVPMVARSTSAWAQDRLTGSGEVVVFSNGGAFTEALRRTVGEPFTRATGIRVVDVVGDLSEPQIKAMHHAGRIDWDAAIVRAAQFGPLRDAGVFAPIDYSLWDKESLEGVPANVRFKEAVLAFSSANVLAYDHRAFPAGREPKTWADFWDIKNFPGPRGLYANGPATSVVHALAADGVAGKDIWPLTEDKLNRAYKKLDQIKPYITKFWTAGGEAPQLLVNGELAMASAFDGRVLSAIRQGSPLRFVWDGAHEARQYMTVLKGPNTANAQKFVAFLNRAQISAAFTLATNYAGPNVNQLKYLPADLASLLSINPANASQLVLQDYDWLDAKRNDGKTNQDYLADRWLAWRAK